MKRLACYVVVGAALGMTQGAWARDLTVDASGKEEEFKTLQAALDAVPSDNKEEVRIVLMPGKYEQYLNVPKNKPHVVFLGKGAKPEDVVISYHYKASDPKADGTGTVGTTGSSSTTINASDFSAENVTFANTAGDKVGQAVALKTNGDRLIFKNCRFLGFQDTLYPAGGGRCYFKDCYVSGNTDFIFGNATVVFDHCTINATDTNLNYYTAANTAPTSAFGYVFLDCNLTAAANVKPGAVYLGRPWQYTTSSAAVAYIRCKMGPHVNAAGWNPWDAGNADPGAHSRYSEFGSMDAEGKALDVSKRVVWSHQLTAEEAAGYTVEKVLAGKDGWNPLAPMAATASAPATAGH